MKKHLVVLSGAGISAESGLGTFRDNGGLWEKYKIEDVATPEAWLKDPKRVTDFYNLRRKQCIESLPNKAHEFLVELENQFKVSVITQNIDDLHERAGSKNVLHLHGEIMKVKSSNPQFSDTTYAWQKENVKIGDLCENGFQLRPHVVWFGEDVPLLDVAAEIIKTADVFLIIGTSLNVYPASGLIHATKQDCLKIVIDPNAKELQLTNNFKVIAKNATEGLELFKEHLKPLL
ncbi:MAG: SIR2 family NAD-dependent protein deacylase [Lishizhenia sp.]